MTLRFDTSAAAPADVLTQPVAEFAADVRRDLQLEPKQLQSKYLYDALGSAVFETICRLPWYRITQAEHNLLLRYTSAIVSGWRTPLSMVELGCGSGEKVAILAEHALRRGTPLQVQLIDISPTALDASVRALGRLEHVSVVGHRTTYERGLRRVTGQRQGKGAMLILFLGSNIGNLDPPAAEEFVRSIRHTLQPGDGLLLGVDLIKPEADLVLAYDDPLGVTAAFNRNLLVRMNRELDADFDLDAFAHRALWNARASRIEMHLVSRQDQTVAVPAAGVRVRFRRGETIWTESSYKYEPEAICALGQGVGFSDASQWIDPGARFALTLFRAS